VLLFLSVIDSREVYRMIAIVWFYI